MPANVKDSLVQVKSKSGEGRSSSERHATERRREAEVKRERSRGEEPRPAWRTLAAAAGKQPSDTSDRNGVVLATFASSRPTRSQHTRFADRETTVFKRI
jgi:hypothetical protein